MNNIRISRRAVMWGVGVTAAWMVSPVRAIMRANSGFEKLPPNLEVLITKMTVEEKAGQLSMAQTSVFSPAGAFNPIKAGGSFERQLADIRDGNLSGIFGGADIDSVK